MRPIALLAACLFAWPARSDRAIDDARPPAAATDDRPLLLASAGTFALVEKYDYPWLLGAQYRGSPRTAWQLRPGVGIDAGSESMVFVYADLARDFELSGPWLLTLSLAAGWFTNGEPIGAAYDLEFKSGLALARRLDSGARLGLAVYHVSNAGLDSPNNGSEALVLFLARPLRR